MPEFAEIDVNKIRFSDATNVRKTDAELRIGELVKSIEEQGLQQPIVVRKAGNEYELIAGQRRLVAVTRLGSTKIPARIVDISDDNTCLLLSLLENVQRLDIDDRDRATILDTLRQNIRDATFKTKRKVCELLVQEIRAGKSKDGVITLNIVYYFNKDWIKDDTKFELLTARHRFISFWGIDKVSRED